MVPSMTEKVRSPLALMRVVVRSPTLLTSTAGLAVYGLSAITGPLLARFLGPAGRGDLAAVLLPSEMLGYIVMFGLPSAALFYADRHSHRDLVTASWAFAVVVGGVLTAAAWLFVPSYLHQHDPSTVLWLRIFLVLHIGFLPVMTTIQLLRLRPSLVAFNVLRSLQLVLETVLIVLFAAIGRLNLATALWAALISYLVWYAAVFAYGRGWPARRVSWPVLRDMMHYGGRLSVGSVANLAITRLDQLLLVGVVTSGDLGAYAVAATAAGVSAAAGQGVGTVLFRRVVAAEDAAEAWAALRSSVYRVLWLSSGIAGVIAITSPLVIPWLFGAEFGDAVPPLLLLLPGQVAADLGMVISQKLLADDRPGAMSHALLLAAATTIITLSITVGPYGIMGAAFATTMSQMVFAGYVAVAALRHHRDVIAGRRPGRTRDPDVTTSA
jgi:O-antigen/teichoic acid export membrane protein